MAALRDFINTEDDPDEYIKPLKEYLLTEGDISGDLAATEEHLKKLKFTYVELLTKQLFLGHVTSGSGDASVARSNEIDEMLAKTKRVAKRTAANCKERQQQASATTWPKLAEQWALLDRMRREYSADLEWLEHNEAGSSNKQILAHPSALVAAKTELVDTHYDLEQLEAEQRRLEEAVSNRTVENAQLAETVSKLGEEVNLLERRAGGQSMQDGMAKEEMRAWYDAACGILNELGGVQIEDCASLSLSFSIRSNYGPVLNQGTDTAGESSPPKDKPMDCDVVNPIVRTAQHTVSVHFDPEQSPVALPRKIKSVDIIPRDIKCDDVVEAAVETSDLQLLIRELRERVRQTYSARFC